jgi:molecular chaperone GrpE
MENDFTTVPQPDDEENETASDAPAPGTASNRAEAYEKALADNRDLYERLLRQQAEMDNFRKRTLKEKEDLRQYAAEDLIRSLLPTLDGFERALQHRDENVPPAFYQGLVLIYRDLREVLARAGLSPIETAGEVFDPYLHQAVDTVEDPSRREHEIVGEMQRGYKLKNKLLRPAIVKVAVGGSDD